MPRGSSHRNVAVPGADRDGPDDAHRRAAVRGRVVVAPLRPAVARKRRAGAALVHLQLPGAGAVRGRVVVAVSRGTRSPCRRCTCATPARPPQGPPGARKTGATHRRSLACLLGSRRRCRRRRRASPARRPACTPARPCTPACLRGSKRIRPPCTCASLGSCAYCAGLRGNEGSAALRDLHQDPAAFLLKDTKQRAEDSQGRQQIGPPGRPFGLSNEL